MAIRVSSWSKLATQFSFCSVVPFIFASVCAIISGIFESIAAVILVSIACIAVAKSRGEGHHQLAVWHIFCRNWRLARPSWKGSVHPVRSDLQDNHRHTSRNRRRMVKNTAPR